MKTMVDSQEFRDIIGDAATEGSLASYMSTFNREKTINDQVVAQAEEDAPKSGFNYKQYYVAPIDERGNIRTDNVNTEEQEQVQTRKSMQLSTLQQVRTMASTWTEMVLHQMAILQDLESAFQMQI